MHCHGWKGRLDLIVSDDKVPVNKSGPGWLQGWAATLSGSHGLKSGLDHGLDTVSA
jgi:hypothetical protein